MFRNIKKSLKYFIIICGVIILLPGVLYLFLQNSQVQTFLVKRITNHFSGVFNSTISVGHIKYSFFNRLSISDILIKDKNKDTLLYAQNAVIGIKTIDIKQRNFRLGRVTLVRPVIALITDSTGLLNLKWYLDMIKGTPDSTKNRKSKIFVDQIDISDARFSLINMTAHTSKTKIDFNNLNLKGVNGIIEDVKILNDTTAFRIYNLGFRDKSGFTVRRLNSAVVISKQDFLFTSLNLSCDSSILNIARLGLHADSSSSFKHFTEDVKLDIRIDKSFVALSDIQYFIPAVSGYNESVFISGKILGTISELRGRNIELTYRNYTSVSCDFDLSGLPKTENAFIYIGVSNLKTNAKDLAQITIPGKGKIQVPDPFYKLGNISFNGSFTGFTTDFVTYGEIRTSQGNFRTDISLRPEESKKYRIKGLLTGSDINLGELTGNNDILGKMNIQSNIDGYAYSLNKFAANLTGKIDSVEINHYVYRNIALNGFFTEKTWDGSINIDDKYIKLNLLGLLNFSKKLPEFDFTLNVTDANLYKLNLDKLDTTSSITMLLTANFKGSSIDNLDGEIKLLNSSFTKFNKNLDLYDFSIKTYSENNKPVLSLRTDFVNADIRGYYNFATLGGLFKSTLASLFPSQFPSIAKHNVSRKNDFIFEINFRNTDKINDFFRTGLLIAEDSYIRGVIFPDSLIKIDGNAKSLTIRNNVFDNLSFNATVSDSELSVDVNSSLLNLFRQSQLKGFNVSLKTKPDNFIFSVDWDNKEQNLARGNFIARGTVTKDSTGKGNAILNIAIDSSNIYAGSKLWKIRSSSMKIDSNSIHVNKILISNNNNFYKIDGAVSEDPADTLHLEFNGINISPLNIIINQNRSNDPNAVSLDFKGHLDGRILLTNVYKNLLLESNIVVSDLSLLSSNFGDISLISAWDVNRKVVLIKAENNFAGTKTIDIEGYYDPALKRIDLNGKAFKLQIDALNPLLKAFASGISGSATGKVNFKGEPGNVFLTGSMMIENASMRVDYLQTRYKLDDSVRFDKTGILFNNVKVFDEEGNTAILSGVIKHRNFKEYSADLIINTNNCLVLNTKPKDNPLFYGTAYASGVTTIKSGPNSLSFDVSAKSGKKSKLFIPLSKNLSVSDNSFITFIDTKPIGDAKMDDKNVKVVTPSAKKVAMDLNIDLEITPDAEAQIIFDSRVGDKMTGHGTGDLNINLNRKGEFKITGDYVIEDGEYLFTLGNILNKRFYVESGGKIMFHGNMENAEIELKAIYKNLRTSLAPIIPDDPRFNVTVAVEPQLNLSGKLFNPNVKFDIYLPNADEETRAYLKNAITSEEELNRQFLYLLVMNSFIYQSTATATGTSAMAVTSTEMVFNQLSNWISQINQDFNLGIVYKPGSGNKDINPQELQVALSTQLLNDKVSINGNFDVRGTTNNTANTDQITGDFDAEVKLTQKIRFKVFNRFNDVYTGKGPYTQGIGLIYKQDFNRLSDLFGKKVKSDMKKEEEPSFKEK